MYTPPPTRANNEWLRAWSLKKKRREPRRKPKTSGQSDGGDAHSDVEAKKGELRDAGAADDGVLERTAPPSVAEARDRMPPLGMYADWPRK